MKRIAVIADSHFDQHSRFDECVRLHDWIVDDLAKRKIDLVVHTGDVFERKSTPEERLAVARWLAKVAALAPVVIIRGNHDALGDLAIFRNLRTKHPIIVEEAAGVHVIGGVAVAAVAWPRKAHLLASLDVGHEESEQAAGDAMRNVLRGLGAQLAEHDGPTMLAMHAMVRGSITSVGQPLVGCDLELGLDDLALAGADIVALGHIHAGQDWMFDDMPIVYPGSPRRTAFGEVEEKGYLDIILTKEDAAWSRTIVPATPMILLNARWWDDAEQPTFGFTDGDPLPVRGKAGEFALAEVRFRYEVASDHRDAARRAAAELRELLITEWKATSVKVEEVVLASVRARAPEIAAAKTLPEKIAALWRVRRPEPDDQRKQRLLTRLSELEMEAAA